MINKQDFIKYIDFALRNDEFSNSVQTLYRSYRDIVGDAEFIFPMSSAMIIEILEKALDLEYDESGYTTLSWWAFEADYGRDKDMLDSFELTSLPEDHPYRHPDISTVEKLYDFLIWFKEEDND